MPQKALKLYPRLSRDFSAFLSISIPWARLEAPVPLYKLLFANFSRLETVRKAIGKAPGLRQAAELLEKQSRTVIRALYDGARDPVEVSDAERGVSIVNEG